MNKNSLSKNRLSNAEEVMVFLAAMLFLAAIIAVPTLTANERYLQAQQSNSPMEMNVFDEDDVLPPMPFIENRSMEHGSHHNDRLGR